MMAKEEMQPAWDLLVLPVVIPRPDVPDIFGITMKVWERVEYSGEGPPRTMIHAKLVGYKREDFVAWIEERGGPPTKRVVQSPEERKRRKAACDRSYRERHLDDDRASSKAWREANPERFKASLRSWYQRNKGKVKETGAAYYQANRERHDAASKAWYYRNHEYAKAKWLIYVSNRRVRMNGADGSHTMEQKAEVLSRHQFRCAEPTCRKDIKGKVHWDHIMPVSKGGTNYIWNLQPLCRSCNSRKSDLLPEEWARKKGRLL